MRSLGTGPVCCLSLFHSFFSLSHPLVLCYFKHFFSILQRWEQRFVGGRRQRGRGERRGAGPSHDRQHLLSFVRHLSKGKREYLQLQPVSSGRLYTEATPTVTPTPDLEIQIESTLSFFRGSIRLWSSQSIKLSVHLLWV